MRPTQLCLCAALAMGCRASAGPSAPADHPTRAESTPEPAAPVACVGDDGFATLSWVPPAAQAVTLIDLRSPELPEALVRLEQGARDPQRKLPIRVAFALAQWTWQVPLLRSTLERAGFDPAQLVHVALDDGTSIWAWPPACDFESMQRNLAQGWGTALRTSPYGAVASAGVEPSGAQTFPYDFIAYGASTLALTPAGRAGAVAQRLAERPRDPSSPRMADLVSSVEPAPLRIAVRTDALLTPGADTQTSQGPIATHRIDARAWTTPPRAP